MNMLTLYGGGRVGGSYPRTQIIFLHVLIFINIQMKNFHTFHQNQIIDEDFFYNVRGRGQDPICENF